MTDEEKSELCQTCGECCKWVVFHIARPDRPDLAEEWFNAKHIEILKRSDRRWAIKVPMVCPQLKEWIDKDGYRCKCRIYDKRPTACKHYDGRIGEDKIKCKWRIV